MFSLQLQFESQVEESSKITNCRFEICCEGRNEHNFFSFFFVSVLPLSDRFGLIHQARISASVNAMRILNTGMEVEAAVADALVRWL